MTPIPIDLSSYIYNHTLSLRVIPNSSKTRLVEENSRLKLYLQAVPEKDRANQELIRFFKTEFDIKVMIKSGSKSRDKVIQIL